MPARIVVREMPVARATAEMPPHASAVASDAAHCRRTRSSMTGSNDRNFRRIPSTTVESCISSVEPIHRTWTIYPCARPKVYSINPSTGAASSAALTSDTWYDHRGNVIKTAAPGGLVTKMVYDEAGRPTVSYQGDGGGDAAPGASGNWSDAGSVSGDVVLSQSEQAYDADGNVLLTTTRDRFHDDAATATGALGDDTTSPKARVSYAAGYYDVADRVTASVDVGTNGGSTYTRPGSVPSRSDTVLVTGYAYDDAGDPSDVTDPRDIDTRTTYDLLGRATAVVEDYTNGTPTDSTNRTTAYTYDGDDHVLTQTAVMPSGTHSQTTQYVYGVTASLTHPLTSNDLLKEVRYPNKSTGSAGTASSDKKVYAYNAVGDVTGYTDQNQTAHAYTYDVLGRQLSDAATVASGNPKGVDTRVLRLQTAYDSQGNAYLFTSYDAASGGSVVNQVQDVFNGLGQLTTEYQSHSGAVNPSTSPKVQYAYTEMAGGANHSRLKSMTYPSGRVLRYQYVTGTDDKISRVSYLADDTGGGVGTHLEEYKYLGLSTVIDKNHPEPGVRLTYVKQAGEADGGRRGPVQGP